VEQARGIAAERGRAKGDAVAEITDAVAGAVPAPLVPVMDAAAGAAETIEASAHGGDSTGDLIGLPVDDGAPVPTNPAS
jgi:hypothetical protein